MTTVHNSGQIRSTCSLIHFFTVHSRAVHCTLSTVHCVSNHIGPKNPPKTWPNPLNRKKLIVFILRAEVPFRALFVGFPDVSPRLGKPDVAQHAIAELPRHLNGIRRPVIKSRNHG